MPGVPTDPGTRILERLELKSLGRNSDAASVGEESLSISRDKVRETSSLPDMPMEPEATIHGVDHSVATRAEFAKYGLVCWITEIARRMRVLLTVHRLTSERSGWPRAGTSQLQAIWPSIVAGATAVTDP
jgi:hypothetical protein